MSQITPRTNKENISNLPVYQHEDRLGLYEHLIKMCDVKIGFHQKEIDRQNQLRKHYQTHLEAHKFYISERAD